MPDPGRTARRARRLAAIRATPGEWTTGRAVRLNLAHGDTGERHRARGDLEHWTELGLLIRREYRGRRFYVLNRAKGGAIA